MPCASIIFILIWGWVFSRKRWLCWLLEGNLVASWYIIIHVEIDYFSICKYLHAICNWLFCVWVFIRLCEVECRLYTRMSINTVYTNFHSFPNSSIRGNKLLNIILFLEFPLLFVEWGWNMAATRREENCVS